METTYVYDALNRNTTTNYSDTTVNPDVKRFYDAATNGKGRFGSFYSGGDYSTGANVDHTAIDSYDALGRPLVQRQLFKLNNVWSPTYQTSRAYNRAGGVTSQTYPSGHSVTYNYDQAGRVANKDQANLAFTGTLGDGVLRTYAAGITYSPWGSLSREQYGTSTPVYNKLHYNIRGQLCDVRASNVNEEWSGELGALVNHYSTTWQHCGSGTDNNGNVLMSQTIINSYYMEDRYTYDALNRLTAVNEWQNGATNTASQQYDYDRWGNRTIKPTSWGIGINTKQFTVDTATNRLSVPSGQSGVMTYDFAGNLITDTYTGAGSREYDAENRMTRAWGGNNQWQSYTYNADGQRVRRKVDNQETWQIYGFDRELLAEYAVNGATASPQKEYGYRNGQLLLTAPCGDTAWFDDALPAGASGFGDSEGWNWVGSTPSPFSGSLAHQSNIVAGLHQHYFLWATATLSVSAGDKLFAYVYLDPSNLPRQIMLQWAEGNSWEHRAYWGANNIPWGVDGTNSRRYVGPLPAAGSWVRLEVPANLIGLEGQTVHGMAFSMWGGRATWDRAGKGSSLQWSVTDHLGTPRMIIDQTGTMANIKRHDYLPFGEELFAGAGGRSAALGYSGGDGVRQQFTEKERDFETGLDYFGARYFLSTQGRFTSVDPGNYQALVNPTDPQSWNGYSYVNNNPLARVDRNGKGFFTKLKNWILWDIWGEEADVQREEDKRRRMLLDLQSQSDDGVLRVQNYGGQYIILHPENMDRLHVFGWSNRVMEIWEAGGGQRQLTPEELASTIDPAAMLPTKPVNLPSSKKLTVDMDHIESGHMEGGSRLAQSRAAGGSKDVFPSNMNRSQVESAIRDAYQNSSKLQTQGERILVQGQSGKLTIQMWVNTTTKVIESAWPVH